MTARPLISKPRRKTPDALDALTPQEADRLIRVCLPLPFPPSVNRLWGVSESGKRYLMPRQRAYRNRVVAAAGMNAGRDTSPLDRYAVAIELQPPDRKRRDLDNLIKPVLDAIEAAGHICDDSQVEMLHVYRVAPAQPGWCRVTIEIVPPPSRPAPLPDDYLGDF